MAIVAGHGRCCGQVRTSQARASTAASRPARSSRRNSAWPRVALKSPATITGRVRPTSAVRISSSWSTHGPGGPGHGA
jgi:hypothetical protein